MDQQLSQLLTNEKMRSDGTALYDELLNLVEEGRNLLIDPEAIPASYSINSQVFNTPVEKAVEFLSGVPEDSKEPVIRRLHDLVDEAKDMQAEMALRVDLWNQFVKEHDSSVEQLNGMRKPLEEIEERGMRTLDEMLQDLETLKVFLKFVQFFAEGADVCH